MKELRRVPTGLNDASIKVAEEVLEEVFGGTAKELVFALLKKKHDLKKDDTTRKPEIFQETLEDVLGDSGKVIESMIIQRISFKNIELKGGVRHG